MKRKFRIIIITYLHLERDFKWFQDPKISRRMAELSYPYVDHVLLDNGTIVSFLVIYTKITFISIHRKLRMESLLQEVSMQSCFPCTCNSLAHISRRTSKAA